MANKQMIGAIQKKDETFYVRRRADAEVIGNLLNRNYVKVIESRQQGKTSLIHALRRDPALDGCIVIFLDMSSISVSSMEEWYPEICSKLAERLPEYTNGVDPKQVKRASQWRGFLKQIACRAAQEQKVLIIALDETATVKFENSDGFFAVLREIYNARDSEPEFDWVTFLLVGAFSPQDLISDIRVSPFNISVRVHLEDFSQDEVYNLAVRYGLNEKEAKEISREVHKWTDGQPYLVQALLYQLSKPESHAMVESGGITFAQAVEICVRELIQEDINHLRPMRDRLRIMLGELPIIYTELLGILAGEQPEFFPSSVPWQEKLELLGIIKKGKDDRCKIRCLMYEKVLDLWLASLPGKVVEDQEGIPEVFERQLDYIKKNLSKLQDMVNEYEQSWPTISDPRERARGRQQIKDMNKVIAGYEAQFSILKPRLARMRSELADIETMISLIKTMIRSLLDE
jgi:hypothetical protein